MTLALTQKKVLDIQSKCAQVLTSSQTTTMELNRHTGKMSRNQVRGVVCHGAIAQGQ